MTIGELQSQCGCCSCVFAGFLCLCPKAFTALVVAEQMLVIGCPEFEFLMLVPAHYILSWSCLAG